jgi:urease accessory protein
MPSTFPATLSPGHGHLVLSSPLATGGRSRFSSLSASYPLKLLSPSPLTSTPENLGTCYVLAYGGGLVAGDEISLDIVVQARAGLLLLTQGSTKVFRVRPGIRPLSLGSKATLGDGKDHGKTIQRQHIRVGADGFLLLLPNAVQPYASSSYHQAQRVSLEGNGSSAVLLDWFTAGRSLSITKASTNGIVGCGKTKEEWEFERYSSLNEVVLDGEVIMRERTVLENETIATTSTTRMASIPTPTLADRMRPYQTYATMLIYGPHFHSLLKALEALSQDSSQTQFQAQRPNGILLWSFSLVGKPASKNGDGQRGGVLRVAGAETEVVGEFIRGVLERGDVESLVGRGLWERIW